MAAAESGSIRREEVSVWRIVVYCVYHIKAKANQSSRQRRISVIGNRCWYVLIPHCQRRRHA